MHKKSFIYCSLALFLSLCVPQKSEADEVDDILAASRLLEQEGLYDQSFQQLSRCVKEIEDPKCFTGLSLLIERRIAALPKYENLTITKFEPQKTDKTLAPKEASAEVAPTENPSKEKPTKQKAKEMWESVQLWAKNDLNLKNLFSKDTKSSEQESDASTTNSRLVSFASFSTYTTERNASLSNEEKHKIALQEKSKADSYLKQCDQLKGFIKGSLSFYEDALGKANHATLPALLQEYKKLKAQRDFLTENRCQFISYAIASPCLAASSELIYTAKEQSWSPVSKEWVSSVGPLTAKQKDTLREAAKIMAYGASQQNLRETKQDVRYQFVDVFRSFKEIAGDAQMSELKVLQSLTEQINHETLGASAWW